jgi:hypothetical protein
MPRVEIPIKVIDLNGNAVSGASVRIKDRATGADRTIYTTETGGGTASNPRTTDSAGHVTGWVEEGRMTAVISGTGIATYIENFDGVASDLPVALTSGFPSSPTHGQIFFARITQGSYSATWQFRYNADSASSFKWEFVGGSPLRNVLLGGTVYTMSATPYTPSAVGPTLTLPYAGDYEIEWCASGRTNAAASADWRVGCRVGSVNVNPAASGPMLSSYASTAYQNASSKNRYDGGVAGAVVQMSAMSANASLALTLYDMTVGITPVRVG